MRAAELAEPMSGDTVSWMQAQARLHQAGIIGSLIIKGGDAYYNRLLLVDPSGLIQVYNKRYLFSPAGEHEVYQAGQEAPVFEFRGWRLKPLICYDLRFPIWSRINRKPYDLLIYVASWPSMRAHHWKTLLEARAIENQVYTIGVNRTGKDGLGYPYSGDSCLVDYSGEVIGRLTDQEGVLQFDLDLGLQQTYRQRLNFSVDADPFDITL